MNRIKVFLLAALIIVVAGCEDFLDINKDPNNPSDPNMQQLLPVIQYDLASALSLDFGVIGYANAVFTHQLSTRQPEYDNYGIAGSSYAVSRWYILYAGVLQDLELLIKLAEEVENTSYAGIAKTLKAYTYSVIVDLWGDVPYTEANVKGNVHPAFDKDYEIYADLLSLLDAAYTDLKTESVDLRDVGKDDLIYGGNLIKWIKANRTIKLKLYTQIRKYDNLYNQAKVDELFANPDELISSWNDSFIFNYGPSSTPDDRNPGFVTEYGGGQISNYISPWFYEIMKGENPAIFTGIEDPRIPYYFVNQKQEGAASQSPPEYRNGDFISIYFGSVGPNRDHAGRGSFTMMGIYPVGGKFDDGTAAPSAGLGISDGTGVAPMRFITYADRLYIEAELIATGKKSGDLREKLGLAIDESFKQVDEVVAKAKKAGETIAKLYPDLSAPYAARVLDLFDAASNERKLEIIMTQKWISSWGTHHDQYTDYRRTGYPVMFDPSNPAHAPGGFVSGGPDGSGPVPVQRTKNYPLSWPYYTDELTLNKNAPPQKNITISRIFWDVVQ